jgi:predicted nucleotidyltransferase
MWLLRRAILATPGLRTTNPDFRHSSVVKFGGVEKNIKNVEHSRVGVIDSSAIKPMKLVARNRTALQRRAHGNGVRKIERKQIKVFCDAVVREFRPQKIILFGSYAYGKPTPDSDVDLLVVLPFRGNDVGKAIQIRSRCDASFALDLLVRKPEFITERLRERDMFIELVMNQGRVIYESQHA